MSSIGLDTDLALIRWDGTVDEIDTVIRARSPSNPKFYFGNFLLFPEAPKPGDAATWVARFEDAFRGDAIEHVCLRWRENARGAIEEFVGFDVDETIVLDATAIEPRAVDAELRRTMDWDAIVARQVETMTEMWGEPAADFARWQVSRYRKFVEAGRGAWFGAYCDGELAADLGVFVVGDGIARFQAVETARAFRRRGLCSALVAYASRFAFEQMGVKRLVIAGAADHTTAIYEAVGFTRREHLFALLRRDDQK